MTYNSKPRSLAVDTAGLARAETLLLAYPDVSDGERDEIAQFLRTGHPMDVGLLSSNSQAWAKAEAFRHVERHYFAHGPRFYLAWLAALVALVAGLVLIKDLGIE
ncbi:hypothetical protein HMF7854_04075 [Sphingomonas ginkgonis]|uniref:Uncharacterized protein n=1 Tax=Sphingomonas ginkgonis TaxID=2315330 RepID=A0A3R9YKV9_9SPHN|nr:hypothetical protein [Sphingomonas ginkgonis]RST30093.1 hypothetical protein HMF7854_04075 [Sphingomonas ginkgonis]